MSGPAAVVIPVLNDAAGLPAAVASCLAQDDLITEIWLAIGPSQDDTERVARELAERHPEVTVVENVSGGISDGLNLGLWGTRCDVLVRVDARCALPAGYVRRALETMAETGAACVGAVQIPVGSGSTQRAIAAAMRHRLGFSGSTYRNDDRPRLVDTVFLGVYRSAPVREVGGWDPTFARNEDAELNLRLRANGYEVWVDPVLRVEYEPRRTIPALARQFFDYGWWRRRTATRHGRIQLRQMVAPVLVLVTGAATLLATVRRRFLLVPGAYLAALLGAAVTAEGRLSVSDRLRLAASLGTMHLAWGAGFLASLVRGPRRIPPFTPSPDASPSGSLRAPVPLPAEMLPAQTLPAEMPPGDSPSSEVRNSGGSPNG